MVAYHSFQAIFSMDLMHETNLASFKKPYAITMVVVSAVTYMVVIGSILFVSRRKAIPYIVALFRSLVPARLALAKDKSTSDRPAEVTDAEWEKHGQSGPWSGFLAAPGPTPRRRWRWMGRGDDAEANKPEGNASV